MTPTCERCGIAHESQAEADSTHQAMADVREWLRDQVLAERVISKPNVRPANAQPVPWPVEGK
jgi:hypothetical protein